jgi:putative addiction module antidote
MGHELKITAIGNSSGVVLSKEILARLNVNKGDVLYLTETPEGFLITPYDEKFARQVEAAEGFMHDYRDVLRELAK